LSARLPDLGLGLAARVFSAASRARAAAYDRGALPIARIEGAAVVSIGNLRAGGSGKTPFAMWLAAALSRRVPGVAIALRGYGGSLSGVGGAVSLGAGPLVSPREAGDEAYLAALRSPPGVSVWVGADRVLTARRAARGGARVVVLDDGFQHRRLFRDCDIVLVCPEDLDPGTPTLPRGPLRERADALGRADLVAGFEAEWAGRADAPGILLGSSIAGLADRAGAVSPIAPGQSAFLFAGVARPERFVRDAEAAGLAVAGVRLFCDHHRFSRREIEGVAAEARARGAELLVTTEKDLVRIDAAPASREILALRREIGVARGEELLDRGIERALGAVFPSLPARR
jgi:tetraacyldisaccharide 4'-kinase